MADWLCRLTKNEAFPDPLAEIAALTGLDELGAPTYLILQDREDAAGKNATTGDRLLLCVGGADSELRVHGEAVVKAPALRGATPPSVLPLYGQHQSRWFLPIEGVTLVSPRPTPLSSEECGKFMKGQAGVRRLDRRRRSVGSGKPVASDGVEAVSFAQVDFKQFDCPPFRVLGVDPTAGTWSSQMTQNEKKAMPSVGLAWMGKEIVFEGVEPHTANPRALEAHLSHWRFARLH